MTSSDLSAASNFPLCRSRWQRRTLLMLHCVGLATAPLLVWPGALIALFVVAGSAVFYLRVAPKREPLCLVFRGGHCRLQYFGGVLEGHLQGCQLGAFWLVLWLQNGQGQRRQVMLWADQLTVENWCQLRRMLRHGRWQTADGLSTGNQ